MRYLRILFFLCVILLVTFYHDTFTHIIKNTFIDKMGYVTSERLLNINREPGVWLTGGRDYQQSYFSPLDLINKNNVQQLGFAWEYDIDTTHGFEATPIVVDDTMFTSGPKGAVYALNAITGEEIWTFEPDINPIIYRKVCCGVINRGVAVWDQIVYVGSIDGYLYALDAKTGVIIWKVDTIIDRNRGYTVTGAPYIAKNVVVIGNSGAEFDARGYISAYDLKDGRKRWRFFTVPGNPSVGPEHPELEIALKTWDKNSLWQVGLGGTVWDGMAYDPNLNLLYVGTGNAAPYPRKLRSPSGGDNLFLASILAINPDTGRLAWYYQTTPADNWDYTAVQKLILADLKIDGKTRKVIMQAPKNGFFYVIDRITGELLSAKPYVQVNWASHIDKETNKPVETSQAEYFDKPKLIFPSPKGGHNWQPMAFNPNTGLVYIPAIEAGSVFVMPNEPFSYKKGAYNATAAYIFPDPGPWGINSDYAKRFNLPPFEELAKGQPDPTMRGFLRAWDPVKQKVVWEQETSGQWAGLGFANWNGGGVMTSAGGLVFQGRGTGEFIILDAENGRQLYSIDTGTSIMAAPMTYQADGKQYVAVMAGLGGSGGKNYLPGTAAYEYGNKGRIIVFKLGGGKVPHPPKKTNSSEKFPMPPILPKSTTFESKLGEKLFDRHCAKCHMNAGGSIPDLRKLSPKTHEVFFDIVLKGIRADRGMGNFSEILSHEDVGLIYSYIIEISWEAYREHKKKIYKSSHKPENTVSHNKSCKEGATVC